MRWASVGADAVRFVEHKTGKAKQPSPRPTDFVVPVLEAGAPYAQYPLEMEWSMLARLLRRVETVTSQVNAGLKEVQLLLGLTEPLTTHSARHSFANLGRLASIPAVHTRELLNHHSVSQTGTYFGELKQSEVSD